MNIEITRALLGKTISIGDLLAHLIPLNQIGHHHRALTALLGADLWTELAGVYSRREVEVLRKPKGPIVTNLDHTRAVLAKLIEVRHVLTHELPKR